MTAKSRRRKVLKRLRTEKAPSTLQNYTFTTNNREITISAESLEQASAKFMDAFGYYPTQE